MNSANWTQQSDEMFKTLTDLPSKILLGLIRVYQLTLSPFIGNQCRFHPSCSTYAAQAIDQHGAIRGTWFAVRRLGRCHPFNAGGFDPVPGATTAADTKEI